MVTNLLPNALHFRAYNLIWNEWFRAQDLQDKVVVDLDDGPDAATDYVLLQRGKRYDYFTCLPFPQKGPSVLLPLGTSAPVEYTGLPSATGVIWRDVTTGAAQVSQTGITTTGAGVQVAQPANAGTVFDPTDTLIVDLTEATSATINDIRIAFQTQKFYEKQARGGSRYTEVLKIILTSFHLTPVRCARSI